MKLEIMRVMVRVGQGSIIPDEVASDELPILAHIWGADNVRTGDVTRVEEFDLAGERNRLFSRYGRSPVEAIYQKDCVLLPQLVKEAPAKPRAAKRVAEQA